MAAKGGLAGDKEGSVFGSSISVTIMLMMALELLKWWYGAGWRMWLDRIGSRTRRIFLMFSVPILLKTLFAPWRRIVTYTNESLNDKLRAMLDNAVSRAVGFGVRLIVLLTATLMVAASLILGLTWIVAWPLVPLAIVVCLLRVVV